MTDKEIGKIAFDKFGLQECDEEYTYFILGYKEAQAKQLRIGGVSQQRELLIDFMKSLNGMEKHLINKGEFENVANRFLSINCD